MKIINRKSTELIQHGGRAKTRFYVTIEPKRIYFTSATSRICEMKDGLYVHFMNEGSEWNFYVNDDRDGFKLTPVRSKGGFHISNMGLINMILKSLGFNSTKRLSIIVTNIIHDKCPVYSLSTENVSTATR